MTEGHTHRVKHAGIDNGLWSADVPILVDEPCATPTTCDTAKLGRAHILLMWAAKAKKVPAWAEAWGELVDDFLASLSPSRSSAGKGTGGEQVRTDHGEDRRSLGPDAQAIAGNTPQPPAPKAEDKPRAIEKEGE